MKLKDVLRGVPVLRINGNLEEEITGLAYSSKDVRPGYLFAALRGEKTDGFHFRQEAFEKGSVALLSERSKPKDAGKSWIQVSEARKALALCSANFYNNPSQRIKVVGITGTKGKTTISYLLEKILQIDKQRPGVIGTISYRGPGIFHTAKRTTPEAPEIQKLIKRMLEGGATHCVMEISSHSLEFKRTVGIDIDVAVFSNLSGEHLDFHKSMEDYFEAKKKLFSRNKKATAIINSDDPWGKRLISELTMDMITYGFEKEALVRAENYCFSQEGTEFFLKVPSGKVSCVSPLLGKPNLYNIMGATAAALALKIPLDSIKSGIASLQGVPGRFERIENPFGFHIFVDYAHSDDALRNLLETAQELSPQRVLLVFGAGGDRDKSKRPRMGELAGKLADWTILTSDNPRSEDPLAILSDIEEGIKKTGPGKYDVEPDRKKAIQKILSEGRPGDYILIAGKGHENYQIFKDKTIHFDDAEVVREILANLDYSRVEIAVDARRGGRSCSHPPQARHNEADAVRSARPKGKKHR